MWIKNARIWDGQSEDFAPFDAISIEAGLIKQTGSSDEAGEGIDLEGRYLVPGLIDAHIHLCLDPDLRDPLEQTRPGREQLLAAMQKRAEDMLRAGITTARDLGGGQWLELEIRDRVNRGEIRGTRLVCAGQPVTSVGGHCYFWGGEAENLEAATRVIERQQAKGVDLIKIMATGGSITPGSTPANSQFDAETMAAMVTLAKSKGFRVAAHCHGTEGIGHAARAGVTTIEHCSWVGKDGWAKHYDEAVARVIASGEIAVSPTVNAGWQRYLGTRQFEQLVQENFSRLKAAGVTLIASTDAGIPNVYHADLPRALVEFAHFAGLEPVACLRAATSDCAEAIGLGDRVGRIAPGYAADFLVTAGNPLQDLSSLMAVDMVFARGERVPD